MNKKNKQYRNYNVCGSRLLTEKTNKKESFRSDELKRGTNKVSFIFVCFL